MSTLLGPLGSIDGIAHWIVAVCMAALCAAVLANFARAERSRAGQQKKSAVATGTMTAFFVAFFGILHAGVRWGFGIAPVSGSLRTALILVGLVLLALGTTVNVVGRAELGRNWANQATIYEDQTLVVDGLYGVVRHPLYASLLWMLTGVSLVYLNYAALAATMLVFLPMVSARARLEEDMLTKRFPEYDNYRQRVGRFLPCWRSA